MAATEELKKYLQIEQMEKGNLNNTLNELLNKVNEQNGEYVLHFLRTDVNEFVADKCCEVLRRNTPVEDLKRHFAAKCLDGILVDFNVMTQFKPDVAPKEAEGIPVVEAENLLRKVRRDSLARFHEKLEETASKIEAQIVKKHPLQGNPHMAEVLHEKVKAAQRAVYYKCLKEAVGEENVETNFTSNLPVKQEKVRVAQHNPFLSKHRARCPHCLKVADVSQFNVSTTHYIKFKCSQCAKKSSLGNWFCVKCSRKHGKETAVCKSKGYGSVKRARKLKEAKGEIESPAQSEPASKAEYIRISNCVHYAEILSKQGKTILSCPQTTCHGWRYVDNIGLPKMKGKENSMVKKCFECKSNRSIRQWFCTKCSKKAPGDEDVKFQDCECYKRLHHPLRANSKKTLTTKIGLRCPLPRCRTERHFDELDLSWVKKMRQSASTYMKCGVCDRRHSLWEWHCFKCKMKKYKCICKIPKTSFHDQ